MAELELPALYVDQVTLTASTRLVLVNRDPGPGEADVRLDSTIALELVDTGSSGISRAETRVWIGDDVAFDGARSPEIGPAYSGADAELTATADTLRIVLHPAVPLTSQQTVLIRVESRTRDGAAALDEAYAFSAEDRTAPRVVAAQAIAPKVMRLGFDEPVQLTEEASVFFHALDVPAVPIGFLHAAANGTVVVVELDTEMTPDVRYELVVAGIADASGNTVQPPFDRATFTGFRQPQPSGRRFDLWLMLPRHNRRDDATGDLDRFIRCLQEPTDLLLASIDGFVDIFDLERAPEPFLDAILVDLGNPFAFELDLLGKRRLASVLVEMYRQKGTAKGIKNAIRFFLGLDVAIEAFASDTLALGEAELGVSFVLGPSERFALYAFNVRVSRVLHLAERRQLRAIVEYLKPAHTHFIDLLEPAAAIFVDHWQVGDSELGLETLLH